MDHSTDTTDSQTPSRSSIPTSAIATVATVATVTSSLHNMNDLYEPLPVDYEYQCNSFSMNQWNEMNDQCSSHSPQSQSQQQQSLSPSTVISTFPLVRTKNVQFQNSYDSTARRTIPTCANMTRDERASIWYRRSEIRTFKRYAKRQVSARLKGQPWTNRWDDTLRGLEVYFPERERAHSNSLKRILQICQDSKNDAVAIARQVQECSAESANAAILVGVQDYYESIGKISGNTNVMDSTSSAPTVAATTTAAAAAADLRRRLPVRTHSGQDRRC